MAPALGFEPRTKWLTATYSTAELRRNVHFRELLLYFMIFKMQMPKQLFISYFLLKAITQV